MSAYVYIIGMCLITAAIRIVPLLIFRRPCVPSSTMCLT